MDRSENDDEEIETTSLHCAEKIKKAFGENWLTGQGQTLAEQCRALKMNLMFGGPLLWMEMRPKECAKKQGGCRIDKEN